MVRKKHSEQPVNCSGSGQTFSKSHTKFPFWCRPLLLLVIILLLAASLRLFKLGQISPPGLNQDEAQNGWTAWCLLKTGKDVSGASWPVFYTHGLGDNSPTLYIYLLMPFQLIGGMNIFTTRLPAAVGGIFAVWLIYFIGKRLFNTETGLAAAALLALNPWHLQLSRWGHEANIAPLLGLLPLAFMLWAGMPVSDEKTDSAKSFIAALGGALSGICCYGYQALRLFIPAFLLVIILLMLLNRRQKLNSRKSIFAVGSFLITFAVFFVPLAWQHIFHPEVISRRTLTQKLWDTSAPFSEKVQAVLMRYINHFSPDFLFVRGDIYDTQSLPGVGEFHWYMLPLMAVGIIALAYQFKRSYSTRILSAFILIYPVSDCFGQAISSHALRSAPGSCSLILLAAVGAVASGKWLFKKNRKLAVSVVIVFFAAVTILNARFFYRFYGEYNKQPAVYQRFFVDLVEACRWLSPRFDRYDAIFCTTEGLNIPYIVTLVALGYDPNQWFSEPRKWFTEDVFECYTRYGKMYFMYGQPIEPVLNELPPNPHVLVIVRPGQLNLKNPVYQIYDPNGEPILWLCEP